MTSDESARQRSRRRRTVLLVVGGTLIVVLGFVAALVVPILLHRNGGAANQVPSTQEWPTSAVANGDDGRTRTLTVETDSGEPADTSAMTMVTRAIRARLRKLNTLNWCTTGLLHVAAPRNRRGSRARRCARTQYPNPRGRAPYSRGSKLTRRMRGCR